MDKMRLKLLKAIDKKNATMKKVNFVAKLKFLDTLIMWRNQSVYLLGGLLVIAAVFYPTLQKDAIYWTGGKNLSNLATIPWLGLALHLVNVVVAYFFIRLFAPAKGVAVAIALLWGIHPIHTDIINTTIRQSYLMFSAFYILSMLVYVYYLRYTLTPKRWLFYGFSLVLFGVAAYLQRIAWIFPFIFVLLDYAENRQLKWQVWVEKLPFLLLIFISGYFSMHASQVGSPMASSWQQLWMGGYALSIYMAKFFAPVGLLLIDPYSESIFSKFILLFGAAVILSFLVGLIVLIVRKKMLLNKEVTFGLLFFLLHLSPSLLLPIDGYLAWASYKAYLPLLGLCYATFGLYLFFAGQERLKLSIGVVVGLMLIWGYLSWQRAIFSQSSMKLFTEVIAQYPKDGLAYYLRGNLFLIKKQYDKAFEDLDRANSYQPEVMTTFLIGHTANKLKDYKVSAEAYEKATAAQPNLKTTFRYMVDMSLNNTFNDKPVEARQLLDQAAPLANNVQLKTEWNLAYGVHYTRYLVLDKAIPYYEEAIKLSPTDPDAYTNIGVIKIYFGKNEEAISYLKRAEILKPNDKIIYGNLANCYKNIKDTVTANYYAQKYNQIVALEKK